MLAGTRNEVGQLLTKVGPPPEGTVLVGGIALSPDGEVYVTETLSPYDTFINGFRVSPLGELVVVVSDTPFVFNEGIGRGSSGEVIVNTADPTDVDYYLSGLRLSPVGELCVTGMTPPVPPQGFTPDELLHFDVLPKVNDGSNTSLVIVNDAGTPSLVPGVFSNALRGEWFHMQDIVNLMNDYTLRFRFRRNTDPANTLIFHNSSGLNYLQCNASRELILFGSISTGVFLNNFLWHEYNIEQYNNSMKVYIDGNVVFSYGGFTINNVYLYLDSRYCDLDEFMAVNGKSLEQGAASYTLRTTPFTSS